MSRTQKGLFFAALVIALGVLAFWLRPLAFLGVYSQTTLWLSGVESRWVTVDGLCIHYDVTGPSVGSPVVLVHGLGGRAEDWRILAPYLAKAGYRVYMPDLAGFGRSEKPQDFSYSIPDQADFLFRFLGTLDLKKADVVGWSMGGWVAVRSIAQQPGRVRKLVLIDSAGLRVAPQWNTNLFAPTSVAELTELQALLSPHPQRIPDFLARDLVRNSVKKAWIIHRSLNSMLSGRDTTDSLLPQLRLPVLIVWGSEDQVFPLSQGEKTHELISDSQLEVVPGCGHLVVIECASQVAPILITFLGK